MKYHFFLRAAWLLLFVGLSTAAVRAQTIQMSREAFVDKPTLPFAPPAGARSVGAIVIAPLPVTVASFEIEKGKRVDEQLRSYGKRSGWDLVWQAPDFVLDQNMTIPGDFESSVLFFLRGANESGARLRAVFYRGNKTVRVTEF